MTEPTTAAGRALLYDPDEGYPAGLEAAMGRDATRWRDSLAEHILAIEAEARQQDASAQCDGYAGDPGASAPRCEGYGGHPGRHYIRPLAALPEPKR